MRNEEINVRTIYGALTQNTSSTEAREKIAYRATFL